MLSWTVQDTGKILCAIIHSCALFATTSSLRMCTLQKNACTARTRAARTVLSLTWSRSLTIRTTLTTFAARSATAGPWKTMTDICKIPYTESQFSSYCHDKKYSKYNKLSAISGHSFHFASKLFQYIVCSI